MLQDPKFNIEGLTLPKNEVVCSSQFVDDTNLMLQSNVTNLAKEMEVLDLYCQGSSSKLNWNKTREIWASDKVRPWSWGEDMGIIWLNKGSSARYLGFPLGFKIPLEDLDNSLIIKVCIGIRKWNTKFLFLATCTLVVNQVVFASI